MRGTRRADAVLLLAFLALLLLPGAAMLTRPAPLNATLNAPREPDREADRRGGLEGVLALLANLPGRFDADYGLRRTLVRSNNLLRLALFRESPVPEVVAGQSPWLFYAGEWVLEDYENRQPYTAKDLERIRLNLTARRDWLAARGARYLIVIAPNKHTVYGEYLPSAFGKIREDSRLDQAAAYLAEHSDLEFLDLRPALFAAKAQDRVYDYTDTHWNDLGGFAASQAILDRLGRMFPGVKPLSREDYELAPETGPGGDLARLLSLQDHFPEKRMNLRKKTPPRARPGTRDYEDPSGIAERAMQVRETGDAGAPRALVFRDSYAWKLIPFLSERLQSAVYIWDMRFFPEIVEKEKPDVVIRECVERYLNALLRETPGIFPPPETPAPPETTGTAIAAAGTGGPDAPNAHDAPEEMGAPEREKQRTRQARHAR